jgi:hypothetical protein
MARRIRRKGGRCCVCHEWSRDYEKAGREACEGRATLFQTADRAFGCQLVEGYEVAQASDWRKRFKPREQQQEEQESREENKEQEGFGLV